MSNFSLSSKEKRETKCRKWRKDDYQNVIYQKGERQSPGTCFRWQWHLSVVGSYTVSWCQLSSYGAVASGKRRTSNVSCLSRQTTPTLNEKQRPYVTVWVKDCSVCAGVSVFIMFVSLFNSGIPVWTEQNLVPSFHWRTSSGNWIACAKLRPQPEQKLTMKHSMGVKQQRFSC